MATTEQLLVRLGMDASGYMSEAKKAARATDNITDAAGQAGTKGSKGMGMLGGAVGKLGGVMAATFGAAAIGKFVGDTIGAASDLGESVNAVSVVFRDAQGTILDYGKTAATSVGLAATEFNSLATNTGALLTNFGFSTQQAADEAINLTERAADMASVFNTDVGDALFAVQAALRGETEPIRRFGVSLDDASIRAKAVEMGLAATTSEVDKNAKATAALALVYDQTSAVAGDFANTSDSLANQQRILAAEMENAKAEIGEALLPVMTEVIGAVRDMLPSLVEAGKGFAGMLASAGPLVGVLADALVPALDAVAWYFDLVGEGALALQSIWDDSAKAGLRYKEAADSIREAVAGGAQPAAAYANALNHLATSGTLTEEAISSLARGVEFVGTQHLNAIRDVRDFQLANDGSLETVTMLNEALYAQAKQMVDSGEATVELYDELGVASLYYDEVAAAAAEAGQVAGEAGDAAGDSAEGYEEAASGADLLREKLDAAREAQESLTDVLRAAADPAFAAVKAYQDYQGVLEEVLKDGEVAGEEILDLADAQLTVQAALDQLDSAGAEQAIEAIAIASGQSADDVRELFTELGVLDAQGDVTTVLDVQVDPAIDALGRYQGALANANKDQQVTGEEARTLQGHMDDLAGAVQNMDAEGLEAFRSRAMRDLGMTGDEVDELLRQLGRLDGFTATATVNVRATGSGLAYATSGGFRGRGGRQHGGPVQAGVPYVVGEAGRELFIPKESGRIVPLPQGGQMAASSTVSTSVSRTTNVTFVNSQLADDPVQGVRAAMAWEGLEGRV